MHSAVRTRTCSASSSAGGRVCGVTMSGPRRRAHRQRVPDDDPARRRLPRRDEHVRPRLVHPLRRDVDPERSEAERARLAVEQAAEHARRVEARDAQPVDATVGSDERPGVAVGQEPVVGDRRERRRHRRALALGGVHRDLLAALGTSFSARPRRPASPRPDDDAGMPPHATSGLTGVAGVPGRIQRACVGGCRHDRPAESDGGDHVARRPGRHAADDRRRAGRSSTAPPTAEALARAPRLRRRQRAAAAPAARRPDGDARPPGLGRRRRSGARAPPPLALGRRRRDRCASCSTSIGAARVDPVRPRVLAVGRDADRGPGGRASRAVPAGPPRAHRRRRRDPPPRAAPRRADVAAVDAHAPAAAEPGPRPSRRRTATAGRARSRSRSMSRTRCGGSSAASTRPATCDRPTRRCAVSSGPSTSPTRSPAS